MMKHEDRNVQNIRITLRNSNYLRCSQAVRLKVLDNYALFLLLKLSLIYISRLTKPLLCYLCLPRTPPLPPQFPFIFLFILPNMFPNPSFLIHVGLLGPLLSFPHSKPSLEFRLLLRAHTALLLFINPIHINIQILHSGFT